MTRDPLCRIPAMVLGVAALVIPSLLLAQEDGLSPSARSEKGFALLHEHGFTLIAELAAEGDKPERETIASFSDLILVVNQRQPTTFYLFQKAIDKETKIATLKPAELPSKALGAWIWYKLCSAADLMESCRAARDHRVGSSAPARFLCRDGGAAWDTRAPLMSSGTNGFDVTYTLEDPGSLSQVLGSEPARRASLQLATPSAKVTLLGEELTFKADRPRRRDRPRARLADRRLRAGTLAGPETGRIAELQLDADLGAGTERLPPALPGRSRSGRPARPDSPPAISSRSPRRAPSATPSRTCSEARALAVLRPARLPRRGRAAHPGGQPGPRLRADSFAGLRTRREVDVAGAFDDTPVTLEAHLEGLVKAAVGAGLQEELVLAVGRLGTVNPGWVRIRLRQSARRHDHLRRQPGAPGPLRPRQLAGGGAGSGSRPAAAPSRDGLARGGGPRPRDRRGGLAAAGLGAGGAPGRRAHRARRAGSTPTPRTPGCEGS